MNLINSVILTICITLINSNHSLGFRGLNLAVCHRNAGGYFVRVITGITVFKVVMLYTNKALRVIVFSSVAEVISVVMVI